MIYLRIGLILLIPVVIWFVIKLLRNPKYDKWCEDLTSGKLDTDIASKDAMENILKAEGDLGKQAEINIKEAEKLTSNSKEINMFLSERGVVVDDAEEKKEESE